MMMTLNMKIAAFLALFGSRACSAQEQPACKPFKEIYADGKELCENMWGDAFMYEEEEELGYTMWFFDHENNPNNDVSQRLVDAGHFKADLPINQCHLGGTYHKGVNDPVNNNDHPDYEPENFNECHPWSKNSCCHGDEQGPALNHQTLKESYGKEWHWDRCGPLSQACERFFVQEACFYECEPNGGVYRRYPEGGAPSTLNGTGGFDENRFIPGKTNKWEMYKMPIKASFCNSWHQACSADLFCSSDGGDFFTCAKEYVEVDNYNNVTVIVEKIVEKTVVEKEKTDTWIIIVLIAGLLLVLGGISILVYREKRGKPLFFSPLLASGDKVPTEEPENIVLA